MTNAEAAALIALLTNAFPSARFTSDNAAVYERAIADLDARDVQHAIGELIHSSPRLPSVAEIRAEVTRAARQRELMAAPSRLPIIDGGGSRSVGPSPAAWGATLREMLAAASRHRAMSDKWYRDRGKTPPPDPGQAHVDLATRGARGEDILERDVRRVL